MTLKEEVIDLINQAPFFSDEEKKVFIWNLPEENQELENIKSKLIERTNKFFSPSFQQKLKKYLVDLEAYKNKVIQEIIKKAEEKEKNEEDLDAMLENL